VGNLSQLNILVTGGAGYIGSICAEHLQQLGANVIILDNLSTGREAAVPKGCHFVRGNVADFALTSRLIKDTKISAIVHFAASIDVDESVRNPIKYFENNLAHATSLLKAANLGGVKHFLFSSTAAVYGDSKNAQVKEDDPKVPASPYGEAKLMFEHVLSKSFTGKSFGILRYFNVAGAKMDLSMGPTLPYANHLVQAASEVAIGKRKHITIFGNDYPTADGTGVRDYIHIEDLVSAHSRVLEYLILGGASDIFNCGYGKGYSVLEIIAAMKAASKKEIATVIGSRRPGDIAAIYADNTKLRRLDWNPKLNDIQKMCWSAYQWEIRRQATQLAETHL
jgi:UDP-glucose 4-epimerase